MFVASGIEFAVSRMGMSKSPMFKILIVEDNRTYRESLRDILDDEKFSSVIVEEAGDCREAMEKVDSFSPDFIFMDIKLPGENGLQLTQKIKAKHPGIIIIILTSYDLPEYQDAAVKYKADHCVLKHSFMPLLRLILTEGPPE